MALLGNEEEIKKQIGELARVYTPEWEFSEKHPDAGSVIALIFAGQMGKRLEIMGGALERYRVGLVNMLGLTLLPAVPAEGVIAMEVVPGVSDSVRVPAGSKFLAAGKNEKLLVFETKDPLSVTTARLTDIIGIEKSSGNVIPWRGDLKPVDILGVCQAVGDIQREGVWFQGLLLCYESFISQPGELIRLKTGISGFSDEPCSYEIQYYTEHKFRCVSPQSAKGDVIEFLPETPLGRIEYEGVQYSAILIKRICPAEHTVFAEHMGLAAVGAAEPAEYISCGEEELAGEHFYPFGERISLYEEFYIGSSGQFGRIGARISLKFGLSWEDRDYSYTGVEEHFDLKPIRKKPKEEWVQYQYQCAVEAVALEYYNGTGWRTLSCDYDIKGLFAGSGERNVGRTVGGTAELTEAGEVVLKFLCPGDWEDTVAGGYEGKLLRFRITRSENCYMLPCRHRVPVMSGLEIRSSYEGIWREPDRVFVYGGTGGREVEMAETLRAGGRLEAFTPLPWKADCLYLGFDRKFTQGPVSFFLKLREESGPAGLEPVWFYSAINGFKQLETIDNTGHLQSSSTVMFMPPTDMAKVDMAGKTAYWLRLEVMRSGTGRHMSGTGSSLSGTGSSLSGTGSSLPGTGSSLPGAGSSLPGTDNRFPAWDLYPAVIEEIIWNAVAVHNIDTRTEEDYYLDEPGPDMEFALGNGPILGAEVYVNERDVLTRTAMINMLGEAPEQVRAEYGSLGEIKEFFVRWQEIDDFCHSGPEDRHYVIDRVNHILRFGNGIHGKIPREKNSTAFTVTLSCCDGEDGNVPAGAVTASAANLMFLEQIRNPAGMRGGNNMENLEHACERGTALLNSRGRLVTRQDYVREALGYSDHIDKAACLIGEDASGRRADGLISLVLLMKDYREGPGSFQHLQGELKEWLTGRCEAGVREDRLVIMEPVFVKIHTEIWVEIRRAESAFEIQDQILEAVEQFIEPVSSGTGNGWEIGILPQEGQILRMLQSLHFDGSIRHLLVSAAVRGRGETELSAVRENPFAVGISGVHRIHLSLPGENGGRL